MKHNLRIKDLEERIKSCTDDAERIRLHCELAFEFRNQNPTEARRILDSIQELVDASKNDLLTAEYFYTRGIIGACSFEYDVSLQALFSALELFRTYSNVEGEVRVLRWIGITYRNVGMLMSGLEYAQQGYVMAKEHNLKHLIGYCATVIGDCYVNLQQYDESAKYHRIAVAEAKTTDDIILEGQALWSLARMYEQTGNYDESMKYYQRSYELRVRDGDLLGIGTSEYGMATLAEKQGNIRFALHKYLTLYRGLKDAPFGPPQTEVFILLGIGRLYLNSKKPERARPYLFSALNIATERGGSVLASTYLELSKFFKLIENFQEALHYHEEYHKLSQDIAKREANQTSQYFRQAYEFERTRQQTEIFRLRNQELAEANRQNELLLQNVLPESIAKRMKSGETTIAEYFENVTVLFADIVGFTEMALNRTPNELVSLLNRIFSAFDIFSEQYQLEKIKTIGDAYMIVGGVPNPTPYHAESVAQMALEMLDTVRLLSKGLGTSIDIRIGIHTGAVVAGIIGQKKFSYDLWGDTVNTASRMESHGEVGKIQVSETTYQLLKNKFVFEERGNIDIKGKGMMKTYFLVGRYSLSDEKS